VPSLPIITCFALVIVCLAAVACGGGQTRAHPFERAWSDESGDELAAFVARWSPPARAAAPALLVGSREGEALFGAAFGSRPWRFDFPVEGQPFLSGRVAVALGGGDLVALDAITGALHWRLPALGTLRGVSDDGTTTLVSIASLSGRRSQLLAVARNGTVVRQLVEEQPIGPPVVVDSFAFLPVGRDAVIVFDLVSGIEVARVVAALPLERAFLAGAELYLGSDEVIRFDAAVVEVRRGGGTRLRLPERHLPGGPRWRPVPEGGELPRSFLAAAPHDGKLATLALVGGRFLVGLAVTDAHTRWIHAGASRFLGARAVPGGVFACDAAGEALALDEHGLPLWRWSLGVTLDRCDVGSGPLAPLGDAAARSVELAIAEALIEPRAGELDLQLLFVDDLAALATPLADAILRELARRPTVPGDASDVAHAREALARLAAARLAGRR
jgi:hypothetical protein